VAAKPICMWLRFTSWASSGKRRNIRRNDSWWGGGVVGW
jgi:hypothetical protein